MQNVDLQPNSYYSHTVPHVVFMANQMMFAVITPALISGAVVERISFKSYLIFIFCWTTLVYDIVAHWIWASWVDENDQRKGGWLKELGAIDFAGGTAVHITSGISGLVAALIVGRRQDIVPEITLRPAKPSYVMLGGALLWFGWFGFNGGSALAANGQAALAIANTQISTGTAFMTWLILDLTIRKQASAVGAMCGAVIGLVAITPSAGYVHMPSSIVIGSVTCLICYLAVRAKSKYAPRYFPQLDDSLDVFTCHGIGGMMGCIFTGIFSSSKLNPAAKDGLIFGNPWLLVYQFIAILATTALSATGSALILYALRMTVGLKESKEAVYSGLDVHLHGSIED